MRFKWASHAWVHIIRAPRCIGLGAVYRGEGKERLERTSSSRLQEGKYRRQYLEYRLKVLFGASPEDLFGVKEASLTSSNSGNCRRRGVQSRTLLMAGRPLRRLMTAESIAWQREKGTWECRCRALYSDVRQYGKVQVVP